MKFTYLFILIVAVLPGCGSQPQWKPPLGAHGFFSDNDASMLAIRYEQNPGHAIIFFFPFAGGSSSDHHFNLQSRTFHYSGHVEKSGSKNTRVLTYEISSTNPSTMVCNDTPYFLDAGTVFRVDDAGKITQLPFIGLQPTAQYLKVLKKFLTSSERAHLAEVTHSLKMHTR